MERIRLSHIFIPVGMIKRKIPLKNIAEINAATHGFNSQSFILKETVVTFKRRIMPDMEVYMLLRYMIIIKPYKPR